MLFIGLTVLNKEIRSTRLRFSRPLGRLSREVFSGSSGASSVSVCSSGEWASSVEREFEVLRLLRERGEGADVVGEEGGGGEAVDVLRAHLEEPGAG